LNTTGRLICAALLALPGMTRAADIWVDVDTDQRTLAVLQGSEILQKFENISVGRNGVTADKLAHDRKTPLGTYHVRRINPQSRFQLFFGLDYPSEQQAANAYLAHRISAGELEAIYRAHQRGEEPPANTPLGGMIGIHGLGSGDPSIHEDFNWTDGCIAVTNEQVQELAKWIRTGTMVVVRSSLK
jgi:murein L,D-transpeptidase YafK